MKVTWLILGVISTLAAFQTADAQQEQLTLPPNFSLGKMPAFSKWQIVFSYDNDKPAGEAAVPAANGFKATSLARQVTVTRTNSLWHAIVVDTDGTSQECWGEGDFVYYKPNSTSPPLGFHNDKRLGFGGSSRFATSYPQGDFPDLAWVSPKTYIGGQKGLFIFREGGDTGATAWIAADTWYPVSWKKGKETRVFHVLAPPTDPITFPSDIAKMADETRRINNINKIATPKPPPPPPS